MAYYSTCIYLNEIGFYCEEPTVIDSALRRPNSRTLWSSSMTRMEALISCLNAAKEFLDHFLALPSSQIRKFLLPSYISIVYAVLILRRFTISTETQVPSSDKMANMEHYISAIFTKFDAMLHGNQVERDCISHMMMLFRDADSWSKRTATGNPPLVEAGAAICIESHSFMDVIKTFCCPYEDELCSIGQQTSLDPPWTDMIRGWSPSVDPQDILANTTTVI